jgi:BirA family biotin operon repressor/biotin-[acetyl-CoA-carboxylase] ligase
VNPVGSSAAPPTIVRLGHVSSTQSIAFDLAARGAPDRTVVVADHQTAGHGRQGRRWEDEPGTSLLVSILLRSRLEPSRLATLSYAAAISVAEALAGVTSLTPRLKWPNDVLVGGLKIAGILLESRLGAASASDALQLRTVSSGSPRASDALQLRTTILGIGVNLTQRRFDPDLAERATSVVLASGHAVERETLLAALLERLDIWRTRLETDGFEPVRTRWLALSDTIGRRVTVDGQEGLALDLDWEGALVLETANGRRRVVAGEVREP